MWKWLQGKKSYFVVAGAALSAIGAYAMGQITLAALIAALFGAGGLATVRHGVTSEVAKLMSKAQFDRAQE